jgi:hypothetical protein
MPVLTLRNTVLFQQLLTRSQNCDDSLEFAGALSSASSEISPLLEYIRLSFPAFPNHGFDHSLRILTRLGQILRPSAIEALNSTEIFCLILAVLLHDSGMIAPDSTKLNDNRVRKVHHLRSRDIVQGFTAKYLPERGSRLSDIIAFVVEAHGLDWDSLVADPRFSSVETLGLHTVRPRILAMLLRIGDLLDLDEARSTTACLFFYKDWICKNKSLSHHLRHRKIKSFSCTPAQIAVTAECDSIEEFRIWTHWLRYLVRDIERGNTYVFRADLGLTEFQLPVPHTSVLPSPQSNFEIWDLRFEIDDSGMLWDVLRRSLYTGAFDHVRELTSNAIDACLKRHYITCNPTLPQLFPGRWDSVHYKPCVGVLYDSRQKRLVVADNGIGMDAIELRSFLFRVASRGRIELGTCGSVDLPTIGTFGVGFISVLTRADSVAVVTQRAYSDAPCYRVDLDSNLRDATVERCATTSSGTNIILELKESEIAGSMENFFSSTFVFPSIDVTFVDLNEIDSLTRHLADEGLPCSRPSNWMKQMERGTDIATVLHEVDAFLGDARQVIVNEDRRREDEQKEVMKENKKIRLANDDIHRRNLELRREGRELLPVLPERAAKSPIGEWRVRRCIERRGRSRPRSIEWSTTVLHLTKEGDIYDVERIEATKPLKQKLDNLAVICVPVCINNDVLGIEWRSVHAFLAGDGQVSRAFSYNFRLGRTSFESDDILSTDGLDDDNLYEALQTYIEDADEGIGEFLKRRDALKEDLAEMELTCDEIEMTAKDITFDGPDLRNRFSIFNPVGDPRHKLRGRKRDYLDEVRQWFEAREQIACQDGIKLPITIQDIAAVGATVGIVNLTGPSRFELNISRNAIDQTPSRLKHWRESIGREILATIATQVNSAFSKCAVSCDWMRLWFGSGDSQIMNRSEWERLQPKK